MKIWIIKTLEYIAMGIAVSLIIIFINFLIAIIKRLYKKGKIRRQKKDYKELSYYLSNKEHSYNKLQQFILWLCGEVISVKVVVLFVCISIFSFIAGLLLSNFNFTRIIGLIGLIGCIYFFICCLYQLIKYSRILLFIIGLFFLLLNAYYVLEAYKVLS